MNLSIKELFVYKIVTTDNSLIDVKMAYVTCAAAMRQNGDCYEAYCNFNFRKIPIGRYIK